MNKKRDKTRTVRQPRKGGNGTVTIRDGVARKTLHSKFPEGVKRFAREVELVQGLDPKDFPSVVPILRADLGARPPWYEMPAYDGELRNVVSHFRGNALKAANALLPIVQDLKILSERCVFHRDIKPRNILYRKQDSELHLAITDFGIAFVGSGARLTEEFRAVGPQAYRAPEFQYARVERITAAGDVFSLGKLLWHMVNGVRDEVFPYTLWHPKRYDLAHRFPGSGPIARLNLLIASCVEEDPSKRPSLASLLEQLTILAEGRDKDDNVTLTAVKLKAFEARQQLQLAVSREIAENLLSVFREEWITAKNHAERNYAGALFFNGLFDQELRLDGAARRVLEKQVRLPIWHHRNTILKLTTRMRPPDGDETEHPWIDLQVESSAELPKRIWRLSLYQGDCGPMQKLAGCGETSGPPTEYRPGVLTALFENVISHATIG